MDPLTLAIIMAAAQGFGSAFGEYFGTGIAKKVFGDQSGQEISGKLDDISNRLKGMEVKLNLFYERFPNIVLQIVNQDSADDAYSFLWATRTSLRGKIGVPLQASEEFRVELLASWYVWLAKEQRTTAMMEVPLWTQLVRDRLGSAYDSDICERLKIKLKAVGHEKERVSKDHSDFMAEVREILKKSYFENSVFFENSPFFSWTQSSPRLVKRCEIISKNASIFEAISCEIIPDIIWIKDADRLSERLSFLRERVMDLSDKLSTIVPLFELLSRLVADLELSKKTISLDTQSDGDLDDGPLWLLKGRNYLTFQTSDHL